jgi:hypothetical protein
VDFALSAQQLDLRSHVLAFAQACLGEAGGDGRDGFRRDLWARCGAFGILGLPVPEQYGGSGHDVLSTTVAMEALGYGCRDHGLLFSMHAHLWAVVAPLLAFGTEEQKARYLPGLADGTLVGAHAMSEPDSGSDVYAMRAQAERVGEEYLLHGTKTFVTNAPVADVFVVFATVNRKRGMWGATAFVLEQGTPGLSVSKPFRKLGLAGSPMGEVVLDGCRVPVSARLGAEGQGSAIFNHSMGWERSCILASQVGRMAWQLERSVAYVREREQFGRPIGNFQLVAARLADMKVRLEASRLLLYRAAWQVHHGTDASLEAAIAKLFISEAAVESALAAVQVHGGYGFMEEYPAAGELRDAVGATLYSGTSEIQRLLIARHLGLSPT